MPDEVKRNRPNLRNEGPYLPKKHSIAKFRGLGRVEAQQDIRDAINEKRRALAAKMKLR